MLEQLQVLQLQVPTFYQYLEGTFGTSLTGASEPANTVKTRMRKAGSMNNLAVNVSANSRTATTVRGRLNGANGNLTTTITASTPGLYEDTTHTDTIAVGDDYDTAIVTGPGTAAWTLQSVSYDFISTSGNGLCLTDTSGGIARNQTVYGSVIGGFNSTRATDTTETNVDITARSPFVFSELSTLLITNGISNNSTLTFRRNAGADATTLSVTITASTIGWFGDTTHTDTVASGDKINYRIVVGVGTGSNILNINWIAVSTFLSTSTTYNGTPSDTITLSESNTRTLTSIRSPSDTKTLSESLSRVLKNIRTASDTKTLSESVIRAKIFPRTASDTKTLSESTSRVYTAIRTLSDTKTLSESITRNTLLKRLLSDTKTLSESVVRALVKIRTASDTKTLSESTVRVKTAIRLPTDTKTLSESTTRIRILPRPISNTVSLSESLSRVLTNIRLLSNTITLSDSVSRILSLYVIISDTKTLSESLVRVLTSIRTTSDTKTLSESTTGIRILPRTISNTISLSESISRVLKSIRSITDTKTLSESVSRVLTQ